MRQALHATVSPARWVASCLAAAIALVAIAPRAQAQFQGAAGVYVDAEGVLHTRLFSDPTGDLTRQRIEAARATIDEAALAASPLRKISLNRLEQALQERVRQGLPPTEEMLHLAGLTRAENLFLFPESGDVVIAGPAEGWAQDLSGRTLGLESGRPVLQLADLIVALRAFPPGGDGTAVVGCSIDPTQEGLARMQDFLRNLGGRATPDQTQFIVDGLRHSLGYQTVTVLGISPNTHFAQVMVEADYRMKLIGIGLEQPPVKLASYVSRANPSDVARNAMQRWFFVPDYECVRVSADQLAIQIEGEGVRLINENEFVSADGARQTTRVRNRASEMFVTAFTKRYPQLADRSPVFAQLRNLIDLLIVAAALQSYDFYGQAQWSAAVLLDESAYAVENVDAPRQVETAVNSLWKGNRLMTPVGGGVQIAAREALTLQRVLSDDEGQVEDTRKQVTLELADGQWWWD